jgi:hypothetical protein
VRPEVVRVVNQGIKPRFGNGSRAGQDSANFKKPLALAGEKRAGRRR